MDKTTNIHNPPPKKLPKVYLIEMDFKYLQLKNKIKSITKLRKNLQWDLLCVF